jgi:hypothetical protein
MAVSFDAWRRAHGFSEADAPDPTEYALRLIMAKGMVSPETTESVLATVAPDLMGAVREKIMQESGSAIPEDIDRLLQGETPTGEAPAEAPPAAPLAEPEV